MRFAGLALALAWALLSSAPADAGTMQFKSMDIGDCRKNCRKVLLAEGEIASNSDVAFQRALRKGGRGRTVLINSPGGNLLGSIKLGIAFREAKSAVWVAPGGSCYSACAYALLGGIDRDVPQGARYGVHDFVDIKWKPGDRLSAREKRENKEIYGLLREYAKEMGVSPTVIAMAEKTRHDDMHIFSRRELKRTRVVTR